MNIEKDILRVNNFTKGRHGQRVEAIVVHVMEGTFEGTDSWFEAERSDVSAHYGVARDGRVRQWVEESDSAWHAGIVKDPTAWIVKQHQGISPNYYTIGVEFEGTGHDGTTQPQQSVGGELIATLAKKYGIPLNETYVIPHRSIRADKTCPGNISVPALINTALAHSAINIALAAQPRSIEQRLSTVEASVARLLQNAGLV